MKIYILHRHRYWTEYLDFLLEDSETFSLISSKFAEEKSYDGKLLPIFNPEIHKNILTPGIIDDPTDGNTIHFRSMHSPGFYILAHLIAYQGFIEYHPKSQFTMSLLEAHYSALLTREIHHPRIDAIRYNMIQDKRVSTSKVNLNLYQFIQNKSLVERKEGTGLICMSWLFMFVEFETIIKILKMLSKELSLTLVLHPCISSKLFIDNILSLEGSLLKKVYINLSREEMISLYDKNDFIITDGSGSCYEAMLRGCKPLAVRGLYRSHQNDMAMQLYYDELEEEYFPFQSYNELVQYRHFDNTTFLKKHFPFLYEFSYEKAKEISKLEILNAFNKTET